MTCGEPVSQGWPDLACRLTWLTRSSITRVARFPVLLLFTSVITFWPSVSWPSSDGASISRHWSASSASPTKSRQHALDHVVEECDAILLEPATELDHNRVLEASLVYFEKLDKAQVIALAKRNKALDQLEWYREGLGRSLRTVSDYFIGDQASGAGPEQIEGSAETAVEAPVQPR
jgi:hypothetical protein